MKVLISGGAGFIGSHITEELLAHGYEVVIIDNLTTGNPANIPTGVKCYRYDLDEAKVAAIFEKEKPMFVIHLAAQPSVAVSMRDPYLDFHINVAGTLKLLILAKKYNIKKFLFASTAAVYGKAKSFPIQESYSTNPESYYAQSKLSAENYITLYSLLNHFESCILRFSNVYGPRQNTMGEAGVISIFLSRLLQEKEICIYDGTQTRDFIYVKDVAAACRLALESDQTGVFNISSNVETTIQELYTCIAEEIGDCQAPIYKPLRNGEIARSVLDNQKAQHQLQWKVQYSLKKGLKETILAYQKGMITDASTYSITDDYV